MVFFYWCPRWDLNPQALRRIILSDVRMPVPPPGPINDCTASLPPTLKLRRTRKLRSTLLRKVVPALRSLGGEVEAVAGFAPANSGFADRRVRLLHHTATFIIDSYSILFHGEQKSNPPPRSFPTSPRLRRTRRRTYVSKTKLPRVIGGVL